MTREVLFDTIPNVQPEWLRELTVLRALERAGERRGDARVLLGRWDALRPELIGASLRLLDVRDLDALMAATRRGLDSPHRSVRAAALERMALASTEDARFRSAFAALDWRWDLLPVDLEGVFELVRNLGLEGPTYGIYVATNPERREGPLNDALGTVLPWMVRLPLGSETATLFATYSARRTGVERGLLHALLFVAAVRDGAAVEADARAIAELSVAAEVHPRVDDMLEALADIVEQTPGAQADERVRELARCFYYYAGDQAVEPAVRLRAAECLGRLLPPGDALRTGIQLDEPAALEVLGTVHETATSLDPEAMAIWLADPRPGVREDAAYIVGRRYAHGGERGLEALVVGLLGADKPRLRTRAFAWLCVAEAGADPTVAAALRGAWDRVETSGGGAAAGFSALQRDWLGHLPRSQKQTAFRDVILRELESARRPNVSTVELLAAFRDDPELVAAALRRFEHLVAEIEAAHDPAERLLFDGHVAGLTWALGPVAADAAELALRRTMVALYGADMPRNPRPKFPEAAVAVLAQVGAERAAWLLDDPSVPSRVRYEAALQIASRSVGLGFGRGLVRRAVDVLLTGFRSVDGTLRMRAVRALASLSQGTAPESVRNFARETMVGGGAESLAATDLVAHFGDVEGLRLVVARALEERIADEQTFEVARIAASRLAGVRGLAGTQAALELLAIADTGPPLGEGTEAADARAAVRSALLVSAASGIGRPGAREALGDEAVGALFRAVLRVPAEAARADLVARLAGESLQKVPFRWMAELTAFGVLSKAGLGGSVLDSTGYIAGQTREDADDPRAAGALHWTGLDGRLLLRLGRRAAPGTVRIQLLRAALFALMGERGMPDTARRLVEARLALADAAPGGGPDVRVNVPLAARTQRARALRQLCADLRVGRVSPSVVGAVMPQGNGQSSGVELIARISALAWAANVALGVEGADERAQSWRRTAPTPRSEIAGSAR